MTEELSTIAHELSEWFQSVQRLTEASLFAVAPEGPHREVVVLDVLRRNARILYEAELDSGGKLYSPLCLFLAAACRQLRASLGVGHWRAALENLSDLHHRLASSQSDSATVGLELGTPATFFKAELEEAIREAGLTDGTSFLGKEDRQIAIGLAINWGIRLLLAYASEVPGLKSSEKKDLSWLAKRARQVVARFPELV